MAEGAILEVRMLGNFALRYGREPVRLKKRQDARPVRLLQLLLSSREAGLSRREVMEALYGPGADAASSLNTTVSQLRRLLRETSLPEENYISTDAGRYRFQCSFPVRTDAEEVLALRREASAAEGEVRLDKLCKLCSLYRGRFLPGVAGARWAETARAQYQKIYQESMEELCRMLWEAKDYQTLLRMADCAAKLFPFDQWQVWQYESLVALGRVRDAQALYRQVERLYLVELDAPPPEELRRRMGTAAGALQGETQNVRAILDQLDEAGREGPYCLPFPSFLDAYQLISRMSGAAGQPVCLMLCTLKGGESRSELGRAMFLAAVGQLEEALRRTLRQEDGFTRYSRSQFLVVLIGVEEADCGVIAQRVTERLRRAGGSQRFQLDCQAVSAQYIQAS